MQDLISRACFPGLIALLFVLASCGEERFGLEYTEFDAPRLSNNDGSLAYSDLSTFPVLAPITTAAPTFEYRGEYKFLIDTIKAPSASASATEGFSIDPESGVISYDNSDGTLSMGEYLISVIVQTVYGLTTYDDAIRVTVESVPITLTVDKAVVEVESLEEGVIATVSYTENSGSDPVTEVSYSLVDSPEGFAIDPQTGDISKAGAVDEGSYMLTVQAETNLGIVVGENLVTVNVGPAPTITYLQQDGNTTLASVTLSPHSSYTTSAPRLEGITSAAWSIDLPDALEAFGDALSITDNGAISIMANAGFPEGEHAIGVTVTNGSGVAVSFPDALLLNVAFKWEALFTDLIDSDEANVLPEQAYPEVWAGYDLTGASDAGGWMKVAGVGGGNFSGMRRFNPGTLDASLVRAVDMTGIQALRVSFGELLGYGQAFTNRYSRAFYYGESTAGLESGTFEENEWQPLIAADGPWQGTNWNGGKGPAQFYGPFNIDAQEVSENTLYLHWRLYSNDVAAGNQNGQWIITEVSAERAVDYPAQEN